MGLSLPNTTTSTAQALVLVTIASALAVSIALQRSAKSMPAAKKAKMGNPNAETNLPSRFNVGAFRNARSQSLFTIHIPPTDMSTPAKAMLIFSHGLADHCCRTGYIRLYENLASSGVDVYSFDSHGHGRSDGEPRGYVEKFEHYVLDLIGFIQSCQQQYADKGQTCPPLILLGHSMGALISVMAALRLGSENIGGLVLTGPALGVDMNPILHVQKMFAPAIDTLLPKGKIVDAVRPEDMSRNPDAVQAYIDDPLIPKGKIIARTAIQVDRTFDIAKEKRGDITCPILMLHGTNDRCTSIKASQDFFGNVGSSKKRFLRLPGLFHEIFEEPEIDEFMPSIVGFASSGGKEFVDINGKEEDGLIDVVFK